MKSEIVPLSEASLLPNGFSFGRLLRGNIFKETSHQENELVLRCFIEKMKLKPIRRPIEEYLEEEFSEEVPTVQDLPVELKVKAEDLEAREKQQELSDLLDVGRIIEQERDYHILVNFIEQTKKREYAYDTNGDLNALAMLSGLGGGLSAWYHLLDASRDYVSRNLWLIIPTLISGLFFALGGATGAMYIKYKVEDHVKHRPKKKKFEEEKEIKLEKLRQQQSILELKLSPYDQNAAQNDLVLFMSNKTGYSLGYVQSIDTDHIKVIQEYDTEKKNISERRTPKYKVKPGELYVLSPSHELSLDDLQAVANGTPLSVDSDGYRKFGFAKMEDNTLNLYTDSKCKHPSYTYTQEELNTVVVKKLIPKLKENHPQHPYR